MSLPVAIKPVTPADLADIEALHERAFGPGRFTKTAHRIREGLPAFSRVCLIARLGPEVAAAVRFAPITIGGRRGAMLLGPLAVEPRLAGQGIGKRLVREGIERAGAGGYRLVVLVGDLAYYERAGFAPVPKGQIQLPGPVDYSRLLAVELEPGALAEFCGMVAGALEEV